MSMVLTLLPIGIALCVTAHQSISQIMLSRKANKLKLDEDILVETNFSDIITLRKTLEEHGYCVEERNSDLIVNTSNGELRYFFNSLRNAFDLSITNIQNIDAFMEELEMLDSEYTANIQTNTYQTLKNNIAINNCSVISEEMLEDNSILIRIDV